MTFNIENIACIFDTQRLKRYCAIITDQDQVLDGASKCSSEAAKRGKSRKEKLNRMFAANQFVEMFYAPYTLEVDFVNEEENRKFIEKIIKYHYTDEKTIKNHKENLNASESLRYDSVLTIAKGMGKGWYATILAGTINSTARIPEYILDAIAFASREVINMSIKLKMVYYSLNKYEKTTNVEKLLNTFEGIKIEEDKIAFINEFCKKLPKDVVSIFLGMVKKYEA